jgi:trehalose 6-phosphate synthase/phosphatase
VKDLITFKKERELVWIHDVHLLLAPFYLKKKDIHANIGFFFQTPFPSSDIYNTFQHRTEVLKSLLCSDVIGFHLFEYARNFTAACRKTLKLNVVTKKGGYLGVEYNGRTPLIKTSHIRVNADDVAKTLKTRDFSLFREYLVSLLVQSKKFIISSVDRVHPMSGVK